MPKTQLRGHMLAIITILFWGTTFISTKVLLEDFTPVEILFLRFFIGLFALGAACPHRLKWMGLRRELVFMGAGLSGITMYYLLENIALTMTQTANVSVIVSTSPFFIAMASAVVTREERLRPSFFAGFLFAICGICVVSFAGGSITVSPRGDFLALLASAVWAVYSMFTRAIGYYDLNPLQTTRRIFEYGLIFMLPALGFMGFDISVSELTRPDNIFNIVYLGLGASALCFVTWSRAIGILGAVKTGVYIYAVPVIAIFGSALLLGEPVTVFTVCGTALTITGLLISQFFSRARA